MSLITVSNKRTIQLKTGSITVEFEIERHAARLVVNAPKTEEAPATLHFSLPGDAAPLVGFFTACADEIIAEGERK